MSFFNDILKGFKYGVSIGLNHLSLLFNIAALRKLRECFRGIGFEISVLIKIEVREF